MYELPLPFVTYYEKQLEIAKRFVTMRKKKNIFVKKQLLPYLCEYDAEAKDLLDEYKTLTNHDFKF